MKQKIRSSLFILLAGGYALAILFWGLITPEFNTDLYAMFGFGQLRQIGWPGAGLVFLMVIALLLLPESLLNRLRNTLAKTQKLIFSHSAGPFVVAALSGVVFMLLCNNFLNSDGQAFTEKFHRVIPEKGALLTHDEILELFIHSRFWFYTNQWFGWTVSFSYHLLSALAGGFFVYLLLKYSKNLFQDNALGHDKSLLFMGIVVGGGYMQLFFGDVENYTLTGALILAYFYASRLYLKDRRSLLWSSTILAVAMMFHLLAGFLLPSLLYLFWMELKRRKLSSVLISTGVIIAIVSITLVYFHFNGLPIRDLYYGSHAFGHGGHVDQMLAAPDGMYYLELFSLFFLLMPASILVLPILFTGGVKWDSINIHLGIASAVMLVFMAVWDAKLGVYNDWNLFANVAIPVMLFTGRNVVSYLQETSSKSLEGWIVLATWVLMTVHSYVWIVGNHF